MHCMQQKECILCIKESKTALPNPPIHRCRCRLIAVNDITPYLFCIICIFLEEIKVFKDFKDNKDNGYGHRLAVAMLPTQCVASRYPNKKTPHTIFVRGVFIVL